MVALLEWVGWGWVGVFSLVDLCVGRLFSMHAGIGKAADMCVVDTMVNWKGVRFSTFVGDDLLD
eukprot:262266-Pelagomonas_calceolata.AAC.1